MSNSPAKISLTALMASLLSGLMLIASLMIATVLYWNYDSSVQREFLRAANAEAGEAGLEIERHLTQVQSRLSELARDNSIRVTMMLQVDPQLNEALNSYHDKPLGAVYSLFREGENAAYFSSGPAKADPGFLMNYLGGQQKQGRITRSADGRLMVGQVLPVMRKSERLGWVGSVYRFSNDKGWDYLLDPMDGRRVLYEDGSEIVDLFTGRPLMLEATGEQINGYDRFRVFGLEGRLGVRIPVKNYPSLTFFEPVDRLSEIRSQGLILTLAVVLGVICFALVAAVIIAHQFNRPLQSAISSLEHLAAGEPRGDAIVGEQRIKELHEFSRSSRRIVQSLVDAKSEAERANSQKDRFFARMSHELRTPLNPIIGLSEMLIEDRGQGASETDFESLKRINMAAKHLLSMISDMLDYAEIEAGDLDLQVGKFKVREMMESIVELMRPIVATKGNRLKLVCSDGVRCMAADRMRLEQILINLISNANKATRDGEITMTASCFTLKDGDQLVFSVRDTGVGIATDRLPTLFEAAPNLDYLERDEADGTGLGLAICKRLIEIMSGQVQVESEQGKGSVFTLVLPKAA